jgi:hypothetical protein
MPKGWLCDRRESGSERRAEPQRHISERSRFLSVCVRKSRRQQGVNDWLALHSIYLPLLEVSSSSIGDTPILSAAFDLSNQPFTSYLLLRHPAPSLIAALG